MAVLSPKLQIQEITVAQLAASGRLLIEQHAAELGEAEIRLNWAVFYSLEAAGVLIALGLTYGPQLIGYCVASLTPNMLHEGETQCQAIAVFLLPEHRSSTVAKLIYDSMEIVAENRGASEMMWSGPKDGALVKTMRRRDDTEEIETLFRRRLR